MIKEPKRMSEEPSLLGASLTALREEQPSDERLAGLAARLGAAGAAVDFQPAPKELSPRAESAPHAATSTARHFGKQALAGLLVLGGAGLVTWVAADRARPPQVESREKTAVTSAPPSLPSAAAAKPAAEPARPSPLRTPVSQPPASPSALARGDSTALAGAPAPTSPRAAEPLPAPSPSAKEAVSATNPTARAAASAPAGQSARPAHPAVGKLGATASDTNPGAPLAESNVTTSELEFLKQARIALAADPAQAYALTERCRAQYPSGDLAQEREYIAISALVRLGRSSEASARAGLFRMRYPSSAYLPRLSRVLGEP